MKSILLTLVAIFGINIKKIDMKRHNVVKLVALAMLFVTACMPIRAQWYVGGRVSFSQYNNANTPYLQDASGRKIYNIIKINPEVGYTFNSHSQHQCGGGAGQDRSGHRLHGAVPGFGAEKALQRTVCEPCPREGGRAGAQKAGRCGGEAADTAGTAGAVVGFCLLYF